MWTTDLPGPALTGDRFAPLPGPDAGDRRIGIEIEFGGLTQGEAARAAAEVVGGTARARENGDIRLEGSELGDLDIYLDTALRKKVAGPVAEAGLDLGRAVIPVELVTPPVSQAQLSRAEAVRAALQAAGATGTREGVFLGFGLHLNVQIAEADGADVPALGAAFAFLEDWLRAVDPIDLSRRLLPFTQRYPRSYLDALAEDGPLLPLDRFLAHYARHNPVRNRGLDLLPIMKHLDPDAFARSIGTDNPVSGRPAYHYRMPDCRIDEPGWTLAREWNRWVLVERAARADGLIERLAAAWRARREGLPMFQEAWAETAGELLDAAGVALEAAP